MKTISAGCSRLMRTSPADWNRADLEPLAGAELYLLARLLGVPHSGTKAHLIARLLDAAGLLDVLSVYTADHAGAQEMAAHFKRAELVDMARRAGTFYCLPKVGVAVGLINWREACRRQGQAFYREWHAQSAATPRQLHFRFD